MHVCKETTHRAYDLASEGANEQVRFGRMTIPFPTRTRLCGAHPPSPTFYFSTSPRARAAHSSSRCSVNPSPRYAQATAPPPRGMPRPPPPLPAVSLRPLPPVSAACSGHRPRHHRRPRGRAAAAAAARARARAAVRGPADRGAAAEDGAQRAMPLRLGKEVQEVLRGARRRRVARIVLYCLESRS